MAFHSNRSPFLHLPGHLSWRPPVSAPYSSLASLVDQHLTAVSDEQLEAQIIGLLSEINDVRKLLGGNDTILKGVVSNLMGQLAVKLHENSNNGGDVAFLIRPIILGVVSDFLDVQSSFWKVTSPVALAPQSSADAQNTGEIEEVDIDLLDSVKRMLGKGKNALANATRATKDALSNVINRGTTRVVNHFKDLVSVMLGSMSYALRLDCTATHTEISKQNAQLGRAASTILSWACFAIFQRLKSDGCSYNPQQDINEAINQMDPPVRNPLADRIYPKLMSFLKDDCKKGPDANAMSELNPPKSTDSVIYSALYNALVKDDKEAAIMYLKADAYVMEKTLYQTFKQQTPPTNALEDQKLSDRAKKEANAWLTQESQDAKLQIGFRGQRVLTSVIWKALFNALMTLTASDETALATP